MVGPVGIEPTAKRLCIPLQFLLPLSSLWAGLSLHPGQGCLPSSLYTFPRWGLARDYHIN
jgi:hypothetical protein